MTIFSAYAANFELYPDKGEGAQRFAPLLDRLKRVDFVLRVANPAVNQGQMDSNFDEFLGKSFLSLGASPIDFRLPPGIPQELDFAFSFNGHKVAVEIEKANREKILRDILKCHMYLHSGADFAMVALPKNYPHKHGVWNLYDFGVQRVKECMAFGFGTPEKLGRILMLGYQQFDAETNEPLSTKTRQNMRQRAASKLL